MSQIIKTITVEEIIIEKYCDFCNGDSVYKCEICGKDICYNHTVYDPYDNSDYPEKWCKSCFEIGDKYLKQIQKEKEYYDDLVDKICDKFKNDWKNEVLNKIKE